MSRKKTVATLRKLHKWPGIVITIFAIHFAVSGIIMNHRSLFSGVDISRKLLPRSYGYKNWNQAAVRGGLSVGTDSLLLYGNIGVWIKTNNSYIDYNQGFPEGIDNRKTNKLIRFKNELIAATQFGLFQRRTDHGKWNAVPIPLKEQRFVDLFIRQDTLIIMSRNFIIKSSDLKHFETITLPPPEGYSKNIGLFNTLWELHSGELFGKVGKLVVDLLGFVTIFLSVTGLLHFLLPKLMKRRKKIRGSSGNLPGTFRQNLRLHNAFGYIFILFLTINTLAGIFLRPPLLIPIVNKKIGIIPGSHQDNNNPWYDKLRKGVWNPHSGIYIFSTSDGFYSVNEKMTSSMIRFRSQPPVSLMGCNVLEPVDSTKYIIGSFSGIYIWDTITGEVCDFYSGKRYVAPVGMSQPVSEHMIAGYIHDSKNRQWIFDYNQGIGEKNNSTIFEMPEMIIEKSPISLWNLALEIHTGRILEPFIGIFYILYIPIAGICLLMVLISGFFMWLLAKRLKKRQMQCS